MTCSGVIDVLKAGWRGVDEGPIEAGAFGSRSGAAPGCGGGAVLVGVGNAAESGENLPEGTSYLAAQ